MFGHYLPNKNEGATIAPKSKFRELNKGLLLRVHMPSSTVALIIWCWEGNIQGNIFY